MQRVRRLVARASSRTIADHFTRSGPIRSFSVSQTNSPNVNDFLSELSKRREVSPTRALIPLMKIPGMISLGTGLPNASCVRLAIETHELNSPFHVFTMKRHFS